LLALEREALIISAAREIIAKGLSTRETERLVRRLKSGRRKRREGILDPDLRSLIERLQRSLGTKVRLMQSGRPGRGKIEIEYYSNIDFERIVGRIMNAPA
ncbi:MAG: ParB/RepB/Spo0J family partition protein, partial [Candidatus Binatia bacterium]